MNINTGGMSDTVQKRYGYFGSSHEDSENDEKYHHDKPRELN